MKNIKLYILASIVSLFFSCKKEDKLNVKIEDYPINTHKQIEVDNWITNNLTNPYNIEVVYRFDRNMADFNRNISPANLEAVRPIMQMMMTAFIEPYLRTGGVPFGKEYFPKQWVLYGSHSYNTDGSIILGTMSNAKRMTLYGANVIDTTNGQAMERYMRTVHHEYMHSLNQRIPVPLAFANVTPGDYAPDWVGKSEAVQRNLGFISPYSSSAYTEDFAEMLSHIVVQGPIWYSNFLALASTSGREKLLAKEAIVREYMLNNFGVNLTDLQTDVRNQLKTKYHVVDPVDITLGFGYQLGLNKVNKIVINPSASHYTTHGSSTEFMALLNRYTTAISTNTNWYIRHVEFIFTSASTMTFRFAFTQGSSGTSLFFGDYDFNYTINPSTGLTVFTKKLPEGTGGNYNNGQFSSIKAPFESFILPYLTGRQFTASFLPSSIGSSDPLYRTFAGFSVNGTPSNYFYGPVTYK